MTEERAFPSGSALISFEFGPDDVVAFNLYHHAHSPGTQRMATIVRFVPPALFMLLAMYEVVRHGVRSPMTTMTLAIAIVVMLPWTLLFPLFFRRILARQVQSMLKEGSKKSFGKMSVELTKEHVVETGPAEERRVKWSAVEKIAATEGYLFVYVSPIAAIVVPRRAFDTRDEFVSFVNMAKSLRENAA